MVYHKIYEKIFPTGQTDSVGGGEQKLWTFFRALVLSMVNTWFSLFSPYFRKFENDVLGSPIWSYFSEIILPKSRYLRRGKIDFLITENIISGYIYQTAFRNGVWDPRNHQTRRRLREVSEFAQNAERSKKDELRVDLGWVWC